METRIDEIAPDIFRLSTWVDEVAPPAGFTFNQFLVRDEQPFLFHTGMRALFPLVSEAVSRDRAAHRPALDLLRARRGRRVRRDEPVPRRRRREAEVIHGELACMLSLTTWPTGRPDRRATARSSTSARTGCASCRRPHVPHNWESGLWFDETTSTLFAGDLLTHVGDGPAVTTDSVVTPAIGAEAMFHAHVAAGPTSCRRWSASPPSNPRRSR